MADLGNKKVRKSNFSPEEVDALVNTVSIHYNVLYGEFAKRAVNKHARHRAWLDVTKQVNRVSVERRTLQEVKNKWKKCQHLYRDPDKMEFPEDFVVPNVWEPLTAIKDSMPLEQRITKNPTEQEPVLQSQPLSPTKLKVTRQTAKPSQSSPKPPTPEPPNEEVCLRWNSHHSNMQCSFPNLLLREQYVDATLVAEGQTLKCHRLILSSCSPYFEEVLSGISPFQHPVLFMKDIPFWILKSLCDFMYAGEVHIYQNKLEELLAIAETLKIKGLAGKTEGPNDEIKPSESIKEEKKDEKEVKDKKKHPQFAQQADSAPPRLSSKSLRSSSSKKIVEKVHKEFIKGDDILDPLDLLEPVYEELTKESKPSVTPQKFRESKNIPIKKGLPKKIKKRKLSEEREESPPPMFLSRKGTRSRPNVKIPKYYHTHYEPVEKDLEFPESTIVREPHTDQADPLMEVEEIKAEPLDFQDDVIEIEDNVVSFSDQEMPSLQEEESNYDSLIVNITDNSMDGDKEEEGTGFRKISLVPQPIIMDVHSVSEKSPNTLKIVDVAQIKGLDKSLDPLALVDAETAKEADDPLMLNSEPAEKNADDITITNVESVADVEMKVGTGGKSDITIANVEGITNEEIRVGVEQTSDDIAIVNVESMADVEVKGNVEEKCDTDITITNVESIADVEMKESTAEKIDDVTVTNLESIANTEGKSDLTITNVESIADVKELVEDKGGDEITIVNVESIVDVEMGEDTAEKSDDDITIINVESLADVELKVGNEDKSDEEFPIAEVVSEHEEVKDGESDPLGVNLPTENTLDPDFHIEKVVSEKEESAVLSADDDIVVNEKECENSEESTALGFHIAKVASEQFAMNEVPHEACKTDDGKVVINEDCASELGFQITNVVSGDLEDLEGKAEVNPHKDSNNSELETIVKDLSDIVEESHGKKDRVRQASPGLAVDMNSTFSEETRCIAESLEELLDK